MDKLKQIWLKLNSSLWFLPGVMVTAAIALALGLIEIEFQGKDKLVTRWPHVFGVGAEGSRGMLSAIASSMITVTGVTFSITIVALALASSQYTPRILRNFMRNRTNQFVLGFFVGVFAYCLIVLRTIRGPDEGAFIPSLAILVAIVLALASVGVLIVFIHHIAASIQAGNIISAAAKETGSVIRKLFPEELGAAAEEEVPAGFPEMRGYAIPASESGFLQHTSIEGLLGLAQKMEGVIRMECGIGDFIVERAPLATVISAKEPNESSIVALNRLYEIGNYRTIEQDVTFGLRQIVDIALKALSPGINDTTTAVTCVDYIGSILSAVASQKMRKRVHSDETTVRVIARESSFADMAALAFDQIRGNAEGNPAVMLAILRAIEITAAQTQNSARHAVLRHQVELLTAVAEQSLPFAYERDKVRQRAEAVTRALIDWQNPPAA